MANTAEFCTGILPAPVNAVPVPRDSTLRQALQSQSGHSTTLF
jgi:hypothetical protein